MTELVKYNTACRALAEAKSVDEVKGIRDKSVAMKAYARQAKNKELEADAFEIRLRAERRLGEMMGAARGTGELAIRGGDRKSKVSEKPLNLSEAGIDKNLAHRARTAARLEEDSFESIVNEGRQRIADEADRVKRRIANALDLAELQKFKPVVPDGKFSSIVIDPPWEMEKIERDVAMNQVGFDYPTMSEEQLVSFGTTVNGCAADDCHLFMWTTHKHLPLALRLLEEWGWKYVLTMVWHKPGGFQPFNLPQYNCEFCLYARKGAPKFIDTKAFNVCFQAPRREHSRKPDEFYDVIRRVTGEGRIDIFSREARPGFSQLGNEVNKFNGEAA